MMLVQYFFFLDFLYKSLCCYYSFKLSQLVVAVQMNIHCIYFNIKEGKSTQAVN